MARTRLYRAENSGGAENSVTDPERLIHGRRRSRRLAGVSEKNKASDKAIQIDGSTDEEKEERSNTASYFDCNICFELAKEPVLTCCGHLFCWPCLYQWLHLHSGFEECPLCKGKVNESSILPIYGRGSSEDSVEKNNKNKNEEDGHHQPSKVPIPPRPQAHRVESLRQQLQVPLFRRSHGWVEDGGRTDAWFEEQMEEFFSERVQNHQREFRRNQNANPLVLPRNTLLTSPPRVIDGLNFLQDSSARISDVIAELRSLTSRREQRGEFRYLDPARRRDLDPHPSHSQASTSSTVAIIQGEIVDLDPSRSPSRGGSSSMVLRRRGRSRVASDSADVNGPQRNRRRVN